jgi:DNA-binding CsgD family transcriptional regulator
MRSALVHGMHDARDGSDSLYFAAHADVIVNEDNIERFGHLVDPIVAQIDVAFRRVSELVPPRYDPDRNVHSLSTREEEILAWVSTGRTNVEISRILAISAFTVKNHVQRIINKLGAANRTEAVARYRQLGPGSRHSAGPHAANMAPTRQAALRAE